MRNYTIAVIVSGLALAGCGGSSSGNHQQPPGPCGSVSGTVNGSIINSDGGSCQVTWQTANLGTMGYGISTARALDGDNMSFSNLTITLIAGGPPAVGTVNLADAQDGSSVGLEQGPMQDELLIAEKAPNVMVGSASLEITSIDPSDGVESLVHGSMTAHLVVPPGAQYSGTADVQMTF